MLTLVLVVGDDALFNNVSTIPETFVPHDSCRNPPVVKHITVDKAQNLSKCNWTGQTNHHKYIANAKPFIFYRHGSYSNMRESAEGAIVEINQICRDEYLLVVGDDNGIEDDILNDIKLLLALLVLVMKILTLSVKIYSMILATTNTTKHFSLC